MVGPVTTRGWRSDRRGRARTDPVVSMTTMSEPQPRARRPLRRDPRLVGLAEESGYEIGARIGAGGMGIVYRATDADGRDVALKLLRPEIADDPRARERLAREVAAQQRVRHPGIARILDAELDSAEAFVATEFIPGPTLEEAVRQRGGLHPEMAREIGVSLGECLRDIHAAGIVHRDLKPSNVLLRDARESDLAHYDPDGAGLDPVIIDFGIAQAAEESRLTSTGLVMGTAAYLDPEVVRTDRTGPASDWWAWAALIAFVATGREPFGSGRADLVFLRAERGEIDLEGLPTELASWLREALRPRPEDRTDPAQLLERLDRLDLDRYDDPGATEVLAAGGPAALDAAGLVAGDDSGTERTRPTDGRAPAEEHGPADAGRGSSAIPATEALPTAEEQPTEAFAATQARDVGPISEESTQALPLDTPEEEPATASFPSSGERTETLPRTEGEEALATGERTEALPRIQDDDPGVRTRALPVVSEDPDRGQAAGDPPTEVIATVRPQTAVMPAVQDPGQGWGGSAPMRPAAPPPVAAPPMRTAPYGGVPAAHELERRGAPVMQGYPQMPPPYPMAPPPPPRRRVLVWLGHAVLVALAAVAPYVSVLLIVLMGATARVWDRTARSLERARARGTGGAWGAGAAAPFLFLLGLLEMVLVLLLPLILGLAVAVGADAVSSFVGPGPLPASLMYGAAVLIALLLAWVGIGGRTTRNGAHRMLAAAAPDAMWSMIIGALLVLLIGAVVATSLARGGDVDHFPFVSLPHLENLLPWRG